MAQISLSLIRRVTLALLDAANDRDSVVQEQVRKSILTLGKQQPNKVLSMCQDYLVKHPKLVIGHRVLILQTIELVVKTKIDDISYPKIKSVISLASDEMTRSKEVVPDWQQAASNILVAVGNKHINDIMEEILSKFQPGVLPHFFVVQTLASLSDSNVYGMVPFLNAILGTMLPMLGMAKQDNMKWVFSSALSHFSESILEYLANLDKAPDPTVRKDTFSSEIYAAYDILFCSWLQSREPKLRLTVAAAVGSMSHLMAHDKLEEQLPKLIPTIISLYKKNTEHYVISKVGCRCKIMLSSNPPTVKNHNEVLRCFSILANTFPDRLIVFVLQKLENSNERNRMGSLAVLRHLINSSASIMETKKLLILASIRQPLADHSNKVRSCAIVQVISAMAHHGYLELEGGDLLVKFIIQTVFLSQRPGQRPTDPEEVTNEALRSMCDNTLHLFTTTVGRLTDVLWPMLLFYLTPGQYSNATTPLCKSLILLATKKRDAQEPNFYIDFNEQVNLPSPHILMTRLIVAAFLMTFRGHGGPSLSLLKVLSPNIHPKAETVWAKEIPALLSCLEGTGPFSGSLAQRLLAETLMAIAEDRWSCQMAVEATRYLSNYNQSPEEKSFLYKFVGVTLQQCCNKELVKKQLQEILFNARHSDSTEREGVAVGIGLCARSHLEATLAKLDDFGKSDAFKKASGIFGLLKDKNDVDIEKMKSTLILCYGYVALYAPDDLILSRIDSDILRNISKHFNTKDLTMKLSLIQSVGLIAKAISSVVRRQDYMFVRKQELMGVMVVSPCVASSLHYKSHVTEGSSKYDWTCLSLRLPLFPQELYTDTFNALQELLRNILTRDLTPDGLQSVFKHIEAWLSSNQDHERERAVKTTAHILDFYFSNLKVKNMVTFHNLGALLGRLAPRCTDPNPLVRTAAIDCIYRLLYIQLRYEGFSLDHKDESVESLITLRERLNNPEPSVLYKTCSELAKIISKRLPQQQLNTLIFMLFEGLVDPQSNCSRASSVVLNTLLKNRGMLEVLHIRLQMISEEQVKVAVAQSILILATQHLQTVINTLISYPLPFDNWSCEMWIALGADSNLASQIMEMLMEKLNIMVPYVDKKESMMRSGLSKVATSHPLAMTCALKEMMLNGQSQDAVVSLFPQLFSSLLVRLGSSVGVSLPKDINTNSIRSDRKNSPKMAVGFDVCGVAVEALRILLARAQLDDVVNRLDQEGAWDKMKDPQQHPTGVTLLSRAMARHAGPRLPAIVECLCPCLNNIYECQRVTITAFFSELLSHHVVTELMMMDVLMNNMMERISDPCCTVRMLAVRGLGNIAVGSPEKVNKYAKELLAAMSSGMEEKDDPGKHITLEAMSGLSKVLVYLDKKNVHLLVVYIFMKIKPFLESENDEIRCASIMLLGNLSKFGSGEPVFKDQIHNVLVSLLLHLNDPNLQVVKACKYSMRVCAPVVGSELITTMFQNHLHEDKSLHYGEFINDLTKYIVSRSPLNTVTLFPIHKLIQFFKSNWAEVRAGAAMFIGRCQNSSGCDVLLLSLMAFIYFVSSTSQCVSALCL
uniref:Maestro heat-like repeat family member 1 n=1 Tax=Esox lucius TaxID=8010 RepID=A0A6Q2XHU5_ESOLU